MLWRSEDFKKVEDKDVDMSLTPDISGLPFIEAKF